MFDVQVSAPVQSSEINALLDLTGNPNEASNFDWDAILSRSLAYVTARNDEGELIGFCNLSWDGGRHAIFYDLNIAPDYQHKDLLAPIIMPLMKIAEGSGAKYLHADFMKSRLNLAKSYGFQEVHAVLRIIE